MKKTVLILFAMLFAFQGLFAQSCYWVFLTDKQGTSFDPYTYFDAKAIERYLQCGANLNDITNYPLNSSYVSQIDAIATEEVGCSRWFNAMGVMATPEQIARIQVLPFVKDVVLIASDMQIAAYKNSASNDDTQSSNLNSEISTQKPFLTDQLIRMQGEKFREKGFDGTGIRIAVFDGGFPNVDKHEAFRHLRENHRIIATWNFPNRKENVYGWNSHGTNTLSCITGIINGEQLGLATGAEFLLARTEINLEPFKEEVWWMQAVEWADKHGANIISSSLGYGKERHYTTDMDGTSYVARAANMAARKGMLVCNSAGNEADEKQWKTIITPADADSVLCVGGIESSLTTYRHISFSSLGPSADGRLKPNVCAYGHAEAANHSNLNGTKWVYGTSFSCPLTAGFAACAWQASPGKTAMEMLHEIEHSGDLYPYFDYAFGYGVPQASYFTDKNRPAPQPTFRFEDHDSCIYIRIFDYTRDATIFINAQNKLGLLDRYYTLALSDWDSSVVFSAEKKSLYNRTLNVSYKGYANSYKLSQEENDNLLSSGYYQRFGLDVVTDSASNNTDWNYSSKLDIEPTDMTTSNWGSCAKWRYDVYFQFGDNIRLRNENDKVSYWSPAFHFGVRIMRGFSKWYSLGLGFDYGASNFRFDTTQANNLDNLYNLNASAHSKTYTMEEFNIELFQRIRLVPGGIFGKGIFWDLGVYGGYVSRYYTVEDRNVSYASSAIYLFNNPWHLDNNAWNFGFTTRLGYNYFTLYARYRLTNFATSWDVDPANPSAFQMKLPRLEAGIMLNL